MINSLHQASPSAIKQQQERKLRQLMRYLSQHAPFYQRRFSEQGIVPERIRRLEDLTRLPFTTKQDLQLHNEAFLCVPRTKVVDIVNTSGTLGKPVNFYLTEGDLQRLAYNESISLSNAGGTANDIFHLTATMDRRFMAGMAYFLGARRLGAGIIRAGSGVPELQWNTIQEVVPTALIGVPSFVNRMLEYAHDHQIDPTQSSIQRIVCIGENIRNQDFTLNSLGRRLAEQWPTVRLHSTYASTEMGASFTECEAGQGGHLTPELLIVELIDEGGNPVAAGQPGELVITTLGIEGMPLLRFRTGDICTAHTDTCSCGRTTLRLGPVLGRKQHMLKYKGTTLYPQTIYNALNALPFVKNYVVEVHTGSLQTDELLIRVGLKDASERVVDALREHLRSKLRVAPALTIEPIEMIHRRQFPDTTRKPLVFVDNRHTVLS